MENKDYQKFIISNVWEKPVGNCILNDHNCSQDLNACKFATEPTVVTIEMYYATKSFFKAYCSNISQILKDKRQMYKDLLKESTSATDKSNNSARELALKVTGNSVYGVILKINPCLGGTITHLARQDIRSVAKFAKICEWPVVTGDTDSVFLTIMNKNNTKNFSSMCKALNCSSTCSVRDIVSAVYRKAEDFTDTVNYGCKERNLDPLFPKPRKLCVEKIFPSILILAKKCYIGYKIQPQDFSLNLHVAGISGKKADSTLVKKNSQLLLFKLLDRKDFKGLLLFAYHLFLFTSRELHAHNIIENNKKILIAKNDHIGMTALKANISNFQKIHHGGNIPLKFLTSYERVGDLSKMNTPSAKQALVYCFENGMTLHNAPMFIAMCRGSNVQVTSFLSQVMKVVLSGPTRDSHYLYQVSDVRKERIWTTILRNMPDSKKLTRLKKNIKLSETMMPQEFVSDPMNRMTIEPKTFVSLKDLLIQIYSEERDLAKIRKYLIQEKSLQDLKLDSELFAEENKSQKEAALSRLLHFVENGMTLELFAPSYMFDSKFAISTLKELKEIRKHFYISESFCRSTLLWHIYVDYLKFTKDAKRFMVVEINRSTTQLELRFTNEKQEDCEEFTYDMNSLISSNNKLLNGSGKSYLLDMHSYRLQTVSTPMIVETYDSDSLYITNFDSYVPCEENAFSFRIMYEDLKITLPLFSNISNIESLSLCNIVNSRQIKMGISSKYIEIPITKILRDDDTEMNLWLWAMDAIHVNARWFYKTVLEPQYKPLYVDFKCYPEQNYLKIIKNDKSFTIHATNGHSLPNPIPSKNSFEIMLQTSKRQSTEKSLTLPKRLKFGLD